MATQELDAVFGALADPTRRAMLTRLTRGDASVPSSPRRSRVPAGYLCHLKVLERAGLITRTRRATARLSHLRAEPLRGHRMARGLSGILGRELRAARRAARGAHGKGRRRRREHIMKLNVTAEPGVPQVLTSRDFDAPRDLSIARSPSPTCWCSGSGRGSTR